MNTNTDVNQNQWMMQLTQAISSARQTAARPAKDTAQRNGKSNFQSLLEDKTAQGNGEIAPESPVEDSTQLEQQSAVQGAAAQVLMPFFNTVPVVQELAAPETVGVELAETLPVLDQTAAMPETAVLGQTQPVSSPVEEMSLMQAASQQSGEKQPVFQEDIVVTEYSEPVASTGVQAESGIPQVKLTEGSESPAQNEMGKEQPEETLLQAQGAVEQPLFQQTAQMPQKVGQPQMLDTESPDFDADLKAVITQSAGEGTQKVELQLEPESLGKLVIQMERSPEGTLHVVLQASNEKALQLLKDHSGTLGLMLQSSQPGQVRLEVQRQESSQQQPWSQQEQHQNQNQSQQQQHQRRQESQQSEDFLQKLRLGLMPA